MEKNVDLSRFTEAQSHSYQNALAEIRNGRKTSHWMGYIFPQIHGLGHSSTSQYYAIQMDEAAAFLQDPYLCSNLREICHVLLSLETNNATEAFEKPDFIGQEVTGDCRYYNSCLLKNPFTSWSKDSK